MSPYALVLYQFFLPLSFGMIMLGWLLRTNEIKTDPHKGFNIILLCLCTVALIRFYPDIVGQAKTMFNLEGDQNRQNLLNALAYVKKTKLEGSESIFTMSKLWAWAAKWSISIIIAFAEWVVWVALLLQDMLLQILIAVCPLVLGMFMIPQTASTAVKFLLTSLAICMWSIGFNLADLSIIYGWKILSLQLLGSEMMGAAVTVKNVGHILAAGGVNTSTVVSSSYLLLAIAMYFLIAVIAFYISGPLMLTMLIKGGDIEGKALSLATTAGIMGQIIPTSQKMLSGIGSPDGSADKRTATAPPSNNTVVKPQQAEVIQTAATAPASQGGSPGRAPVSNSSLYNANDFSPAEYRKETIPPPPPMSDRTSTEHTETKKG